MTYCVLGHFGATVPHSRIAYLRVVGVIYHSGPGISPSFRKIALRRFLFVPFQFYAPNRAISEGHIEFTLPMAPQLWQR